MSRSIPYQFGRETLREVSQPADYPQGKCFVIQFFQESVVHHEGDERSRQFPGHGYPAYDERVLTVRQFVTEDYLEWRAALDVLYAEGPRDDVAVLVVTRVDVSVCVDVDVPP